MMHLVDTSVIIATLTTETGSDEAIRWLAQKGPGQLVINDWTLTEVNSALALKMRSSQVSKLGYSLALTAFGRWKDGGVLCLPIRREHFALASEMCGNLETGLRAPDALHLAVAFSIRLPTVTMDKGFARAAQAMGLGVELLPS